MTWTIKVATMPGDDDDTLGYVSEYEGFQFEDELSDTGSGSVVLLQGAVPDEWVEENTLWRFYQDGLEDPRFGFIVEQVEDLPVNDDEQYRIKISGRGTGAVLGWARLFPGNYYVSPKVDRVWTGRSYPDVFHLFTVEAQNRLTISFVDRLWDSVNDSDGVPWSRFFDGNEKAGDTLLELVQRWKLLQPFDWHMSATFGLSLYNQAGLDVSDDVVFFPGGGINEQVITRDRREIENVIVVEDTADRILERVNQDSIDKWLRREGYLRPTEAIDATTSDAIGTAYADSVGQEQVERVIGVDPVDGRLPFYDFNVGDIVAVQYPTGRFKFRCLAITVGVDKEGDETVEAVLDTVLKPERDTVSDTGGSSSVGNSTLVYAENAPEIVVNTLGSLMGQVPIEVLSATNGRAGMVIRGVASAPLTLTVEVLMDSTVVKTYKQKVDTGEVTFGHPFIIVGMPEGVENWRLRLTTSSGTFTMPAGQSSWWVESRDLAGGLGQGTPDQIIDEDAPFHDASHQIPLVELQTPISAGGTIFETMENWPDTVTDVNSSSAGYTVKVTAGADDGYVSSSPSFTSSSIELQAGNAAGEIRETFVRFDIPDLVGREIFEAWIEFHATANSMYTPSIKIYASTSGVAVAPTTKAEFDAITRTTAVVDWDALSLANNKTITPDLTTIIQEVVDGNVATTSLLFTIDDDGSVADAYHVWRSFNDPNNTPPILTVKFR